MINTKLFTLKTAIFRTALALILGLLAWQLVLQKSGGIFVISAEALLFGWYQKSTGVSLTGKKGSAFNLDIMSVMSDDPHNDERELNNMIRAHLAASRVLYIMVVLYLVEIIVVGLFMAGLSKVMIIDLSIGYVLLTLIVMAWTNYFAYRYFDENF